MVSYNHIFYGYFRQMLYFCYEKLKNKTRQKLIYKGHILNSWGKKQVVVIDKSFYETIPIKTSGQTAKSLWFFGLIDFYAVSF